MGETFTLHLPGRPGYLSTARIFAAAVARRFGLDDASVEDLRLAVSEACGLCIAGRELRTGDPVQVTFEREGDRLLVRIEDSAARAAVTTTPGGWGQDVIRALFEDARIRADLQGTEVVFSTTHP